MTRKGYILRLRKCRTQEEVDNVVRAITADPEISGSKREQLMQSVKTRRAELPDRA